MAIFVASLFLPYTINFDAPQKTAAPAPPRRPSRTDGKALSLFDRPSTAPLPVLTPGATTDHERIFILPEQQTFKIALPENKHPCSIASVDPFSPAWGKGARWTQPQSRADEPPPASILRHNGRERTATMMWQAQAKYKAQQKVRPPSHERNFSQSNFTVEQAMLGNGGLRNAVQAAADSGYLKEKTWVGTIGMPTDALTEHVKRSISEKLENDFDSLTVYVGDNDFDGHYSHYCKTILWPHFHYQIPDSPKSKAYEDHSFGHYVKLNQAFADRITKNWKRGDVIWIHDYHLLLLPSMLRKQLPDAQIGFFLHVAFPSSEIFRCLATRKELLDGMLGANLLGFQTDEYGHHFLQTCSRLLCVEATKDGVQLEERFVNVDTFPIGIDPQLLDQRREAPDVAEWIKIIQDKYHGKRIIVGRDKLDNIRGVRQKILAYELFLNMYPTYSDKVVLIQIATSTTEQTELEATVSDIVTRVNSTHSTLAHQPLVFLKQDISYSQYLALITVAECFMITSLREGMNLTSHEYVYCQDGKHGNKKYGPLILSEFTGSASVFGEQDHELLVNPWDARQSANAIKRALDMSPHDRKCRWHGLYGSVMHHTAVHWVQSNVQHLEAVWKEHAVRDIMAVPRLSFPAVSEKYEKADRRLLILDYEGTLASWGSPTSIILTTPKRAIDALNDLIEDRKNAVYVMSARMPEEMERLFRQVPGLGLIAESGSYLMEAGADDWIEIGDIEHAEDWKVGVKSILKYYQERIEGSKVEERHCSLIFDYRNAEDPETAQKQVGECTNHINDACQGLKVQAVITDATIVVSHSKINKSSATAEIVKSLEKLKDDKDVPLPDFLLVIGDSRDDEYVFSWAKKLEGKTIRDVVTVTLGGRATEASATITGGVTGRFNRLDLENVVSLTVIRCPLHSSEACSPLKAAERILFFWESRIHRPHCIHVLNDTPLHSVRDDRSW